MIKTVTKFYTYGDAGKGFELKSGSTLSSVTLAYETMGELNEHRDNAVLLFHALTGSQHFAGFNPAVDGVGSLWNEECQTGWWDGYVGPGKPVDTDRFFVVCANYLGGCYGSTGPSSVNPANGCQWGGDFPVVTFGDIVDSQLPLYRHLGIDRFHAVIGPSIGGMMALNLAARYPGVTDRVALLGTGIETTTLTRTHNLEQILAIENDPNFNYGHYYDGPHPARGLALARMISHKTFVSLRAMEERMSDKCEQEHDEFSWYKIVDPLESYILHQGRKLVRRFDANTYLQLMAAWTKFNLLRDCAAANYTELFSPCRHMRFVLFTIDSDVCFYPEEQELLHEILTENGIESERVIVESDKGHDSFLLEPDKYFAGLKKLLAD